MTLGFLDRVVFTASSGTTGSFIQGSSVTGYQLMAGAGAVGGITYRYGAQSTDLTQWEYGYGVWTSSNNTLTRNPLGGSGGSTSPVSFTNPPQVMITLLAEDLVPQAAGGNLSFFMASSTSGIAADTNPGSSLAPFLTLARGFREVVKYDYQGQFTWTINIADGTYPETGGWNIPSVLNPPTQGGTVKGNLTTPGNVNFTNSPRVKFSPAPYQVKWGGTKHVLAAGAGAAFDVGNGAGSPGAEGGIVFNGDITVDFSNNSNAIGFLASGGALLDGNGINNVNILGGGCLTYLFANSGGINTCFDGGITHHFPGSTFNISNAFIECHGGGQVVWLDNSSGAPTVAAGVIGTGGARITSQNGLKTDIPGVTVFGDNTIIWGNNTGGGGAAWAEEWPGMPPATVFPNLPSWAVFKNTVGGGIFLIAFDVSGQAIVLGGPDQALPLHANLGGL